MKRLVQLDFEHNCLFGTCGEFSVPFTIPKYLCRRFEASGEGVGFGPPSHVSRVDFSRVEKRWRYRFSQTAFDLVQAHPHALSDVTLSAFGS